MKLILLILSLLCTISGFAQGILNFEKTTVNLNKIKADDQPTYVSFKFKNTGNQPIIISRVNSITSQIKTEWEKAPIPPGKSSEIKASFISAEMPEKFDFNINVFSNAQNPRQTLNLGATIIENPAKMELSYKYNMQGIKFKSGMLSFDKIYTHQTLSDTVYFFNSRKDDVKIEPKYLPEYIQVKPVSVSIAPGKKGMFVISFDAQKKNDYGYCYETILFSYNGDMADYQNRLTLTALITEDFSKLTQKQLASAPIAFIEKKDFDFGNIKEGEKANCDYVLVNKGKTELSIRKTKAGCGCTAVTMGESRIAPGQSTTIRATFDSSGKRGRQYKSVTIITNDPKNPEIIVNLSGNVVEK